MRKIIVSDPKKCTGCKTCEMVCSFTNEQGFSPQKARIRNITILQEAVSMSLTCYQCEDAPCVQVCPSGAISMEGRIAKIDPSVCIGCRLCLLACPFGNINFPEEKGAAVKCELCGNDPQCVLFCPTGALQYKEVDTIVEDKKMRLFTQLKNIYL